MTRNVQTAPDRIAVLGPELSWTYSDLHQRALGLAAQFRALGIGRGDVVAIQLPNIAEFILTYLATGYAGAILQTLHMPYRGAEIEMLLAHSGAKAIVCMAQGKDFNPAEAVLAMKPRLPKLQHVIAVGPDAGRRGCVRCKCARRGNCRQAESRPTISCCSTPPAPCRRRRACRSPYRKFLANARLSAKLWRSRRIRSCCRPRRIRMLTACSRSIWRIAAGATMCAAAGVLAARSGGSDRQIPADAGLHRARAHDCVSARRTCSIRSGCRRCAFCRFPAAPVRPNWRRRCRR